MRKNFGLNHGRATRLAGVALGLFLVGSLWAAGSVKVANLRCEYKADPIGVDAARPRLSWILEATKPSLRGLKQTGYQILVASSPAALKADRGDLWDSSRVAGDQSVNVEYAGPVLKAAQDCHWKVRVWDQEDKPSDWSANGRWTMGLLQPADWQARWIGHDADPDGADAASQQMQKLLSLQQAPWVWLPGTKSGNQPVGAAYFRKGLDLPAGQKVLKATFLIVADDGFTLFVNGQESGTGTDWKQPRRLDVTARLQAGQNVLAIQVNNAGSGPSPAGLMGLLVVLLESGAPVVVPVDASWQGAAKPGDRWQGPEYDATRWAAVSVIGKNGVQPWGTVKSSGVRMLPPSHFRKSFSVDKPLQRAVLFASALGIYDLQVNGKALNSDVLSPGWTDYSKRVHYFGYDLTSQLKRGPNTLGAMLGDGWYASYLAFSGRRNYYGDKTRFIAQLRLDYVDGSSEIIGTDASWKAAHGPVREADLLMGCVYDARQEMPGWSTPGFDDAAWASATVDASVRLNHLEAQPNNPMRRIQELPSRELKEPKPGVYVFDLKQNMVGWARVKLKGGAGQKVTVRHAEMLNPDGTVYITNLRAAKATDTYHLDGGAKRAFEPYFTFHGFQYVEITGLDYRPELSDVTGVVVHSDLPRAGSFECSNPLVNKLVENAVWGQRGNFLDVPTDCPQRDERAGWTGDAQVFMKTACLNLDAPAFFTKWLVDLCQDSQNAQGGFGDVAPHINVVGFGNTGWADSGLVCNWQMYQLYGDTRVVRQHYPALLRYMEYLAKTSKDNTRGTGAFGDWLRLAGPQHSEAIGTAYYFYSSRLMSELAGAIGKTDDAAKYRAQAEAIKATFIARFIKEDGRIVDSKDQTGQTFYALAFALDLVPQERREAVARQFVASIEKQGNHLATGFLGTPVVLFALEKAGQANLAYRLVLNETYPSWLLQVKLGSSTMWERWDGWLPDKGFQDAGMNSFNHYWLGCVVEWLQCSVAGLDTDGAGFGRITIRPVIESTGKGLTHARGSYDSIRGRIVSGWRREKGGLSLNVTIPANTIATIHVPAQDPASVREGGKATTGAKGLKFLRNEPGYVVFEAGSGQYAFTSQ
jgi:alpha-L-rhamnosidase